MRPIPSSQKKRVAVSDTELDAAKAPTLAQENKGYP